MADPVIRPSDRARVRNTRDKILDAAQKLVDTAAAEGRYLSPPARAELAKLAKLHPQTVRSHFQDWAAVCAALRGRYRMIPGAVVPENVNKWAQEHFDREIKPSGRQLTEVAEAGELRDRYAAASTTDDDTDLALTAAALVRQLSSTPVLLEDHAGEIVDCARSVQDRLDVVSATTDALVAALTLADAAVQAHRHLAHGPAGSGNAASEQTRLILKLSGDAPGSRGAAHALRKLNQMRYEPQHLQAIIRIKRWDKDISTRLGHRVRVVLAQFHIDRAEAMIGDRPEDEIASITKVVAELRSLQKGERPVQTDPADVAMLVARLAGICLAYSDQIQDGELGNTRSELLRLFDTFDQDKAHETRQLKKDAQSLFKLVDDKPVEATELLRAIRFSGPGDFLLARHLVAQAEMSDEQIEHRFGPTLGPPDHVRILLLKRAHSCYQRVQETSRVSGCAARLSGMAEAEMTIAAHRIGGLSAGGAALPQTPTGGETIKHLQRNINDLVHRAVLGESLDRRQVGILVNSIDPIRTFLIGRHRL